jgi:hypothetical protein
MHGVPTVPPFQARYSAGRTEWDYRASLDASMSRTKCARRRSIPVSTEKGSKTVEASFFFFFLFLFNRGRGV